MSWTREKLEKARRLLPAGYARLAAFVRAPSLSLEDVLRACERHRRACPRRKARS